MFTLLTTNSLYLNQPTRLNGNLLATRARVRRTKRVTGLATVQRTHWVRDSHGSNLTSIRYTWQHCCHQQGSKCSHVSVGQVPLHSTGAGGGERFASLRGRTPARPSTCTRQRPRPARLHNAPVCITSALRRLEGRSHRGQRSTLASYCAATGRQRQPGEPVWGSGRV